MRSNTTVLLKNHGKLAALLGLLLFAGCSNVQRLPADVVQHSWYWPLPLMLVLQVEPVAALSQDYLLVLQDDSGMLRALLFDPAGMPVARKQLRNGRWRNEGLLPPAPAVDSWLTAIVHELTALAPAINEDSIMLKLDDGSQLRVRQLEQP